MMVVVGLMGQEKKIKYEIEPLHSVGDEQFRRSMGSLLTPPMLAMTAQTT